MFCSSFETNVTIDRVEMMRHLNKRGERGNAIIEFGLIAPLLLPLILVAVDGGLYAVAFVAVQNGVRVAAMRNSGGLDSAADQARPDVGRSGEGRPRATGRSVRRLAVRAGVGRFVVASAVEADFETDQP